MIKPMSKEKSQSSTGSTTPQSRKHQKTEALNKEREALKELPKRIEEMKRNATALPHPCGGGLLSNAQNDPGRSAKTELLENEILEAYETWEELTELSETL